MLISGTPLYEDQAPLRDEELAVDIGTGAPGTSVPSAPRPPTPW